MYKTVISDSLIPNLASLRLQYRCLASEDSKKTFGHGLKSKKPKDNEIFGVLKDRWGYPVVPVGKLEGPRWRNNLPKAEPEVSTHLLPVQDKARKLNEERTLQTSQKLLEYLENDRGHLKNLFEMECTDTVSPVPFEQGLIRTGLIGRKQGETPMFMRNGEIKTCTVIEIPQNYVVSCNPWFGKYRGRDDLHVMKIGAFDHDKIDEVPLVTQQEYLSVGIAPKMAEKFFIVSPENVLPVGYKLDMSHFFVGQYLDIMGTSINRGFQGVIRRWGYKGQGNSRGRTKTHRRPGSISTQGLARVLKGKKMPGIMGNRNITDFSRHIVYANYNRRYMIVKGPILGPVGCFVNLADSVAKAPIQASLLHYPTFIPSADAFGHEIYDQTVIDPSESLETLLAEKSVK